MIRTITRLTCSALCCVAFLTQPYSIAQSRGATKMNYLHDGIEAKARVLNPSDEQTIHPLVDEVLKFPRTFGRLPEPIDGLVNERLVHSEGAYLRGERTGIDEQEIVRLFNSLADKFAAPEYAKTSLLQVRVLRMQLSLSSPAFMGRGLTRDEAKVGDSINSTMSPLQATHVIETLIDQKLLNPDYQVPPSLWDGTYFSDAQVKSEALQQAMGRSSEIKTKIAAAVRENPKRQEMHDLLSREMSSMSLAGAAELINEVLATLKID